MSQRHIVAIGGGGLDVDPASTGRRMDDFILTLARRSPTRVCLLPTASGEHERYLVSFYRAFGGRGCIVSHLGLFQRDIDDVRSFLLDQDVIYVGGGNTANMLAIWRLHGVDAVLREAWDAGVVLCGVSAGALCWFDGGVTDSFGTSLAPLTNGLGFLSGSFCPHYDGEPGRRPAFQRFVSEGLPDGVAADDGCALHYVGTDLSEIVTTRAEAMAYRVVRRPDSSVDESVLSVRLLT